MKLKLAQTYVHPQAEDGGGRSAATSVVFEVTEVNDPPQCSSTSLNVLLNKNTPVGGPVVSLQCTDPDDPTNSSALTYVLSGSLAGE